MVQLPWNPILICLLEHIIFIFILHTSPHNSTLFDIKNFAVTHKNYTGIAESNNYVSPYNYYLTFTIPNDDITLFGVPVYVGVTSTGAIPLPVCLYENNGIYKASIASNSPQLDIAVVFVDVYCG